MFRYKEISAVEVASAVRFSAEAILAAVSVELGLRSVRIQWFRKAVAGEVPDHVRVTSMAGEAWRSRRDRILVSAEQRPEETARTVAHELKHLEQFSQGTLGNEFQARIYEARRAGLNPALAAVVDEIQKNLKVLG